uniref:CSON003838 protein n=1 Tax=Culicoides sonorensis TaxID=179676 RepID=A0A336L2C5_CULSO
MITHFVLPNWEKRLQVKQAIVKTFVVKINTRKMAIRGMLRHKLHFSVQIYGIKHYHMTLISKYINMPIWMNFYQKMVSQWMDCQAIIWDIQQLVLWVLTNQIPWAVISGQDSRSVLAR